MNTGKKHVPLLRFPTFRQDGEWGNVKLGDCLLQTPDYGLNAPAVPYSESLPTYLRITDITDSGKFDKSHLASVNAVITPENSLQEGDLVVARTGASVGKVYKYKKEDGLLVFAGFLIRLRPNLNRCNSEYLFQYMLSPSYKRWVDITSTRSGQPGINSTEYASLTVPFPQKLSEQQKIAECLSSVDSYISSIYEKVEQLKAHKTSLLQKLFPQRGQTIPEYRFSEFNNTKEWEIKKLGDIATTFSGGTPSINKKQYYGGDIPFIRSGEIKGTKTELSLTQLGVEESSAKLVSAGTILYALYGATSGEVAISKISGAINQAILAIIVDNELCEVQFLYQILLANKEKILDKYLQGGQGNLSGSIITNLQILLPTIEEQRRIAECLSSIDRTIKFYTEKTSQLEQHKKGIMQQLFPKA